MKNTSIAPVLIAVHEHISKTHLQGWEFAKDKLQALIKLYNATGLPALAGGELDPLFNDTANLLYDKLTGNEAAHLTIGKGEDRGHLAIDRTAAMALISKPKGYNELLAGITQCSRDLMTGKFPTNQAYNIRVNITTISQYFVIDESGVPDYTDKVKNDIEEAGNLYAKTDKGQKIYAFFEKVKDAFFECGLDEYVHESQKNILPGAKVGELISEGIRSINVAEKTFMPAHNAGNSIFPVLLFDNDRKPYL